MTTIKQEDFIQSIADEFQFIANYHPVDFIKAMGEAYEREQSPAARNAIAQILMNSRRAAEGHRPMCQDTGAAVVFLKIGMDVRWDAKMSIQEMVNEGVRRAYTDKDNPLRASMLSDPAGARKNTRDNTPAMVYTDVVPEYYEIDPMKCTECVGHFDTPQCVEVCPVDCISVDPDHVETKDALKRKDEALAAAGRGEGAV